jgi:ribose 5-phosphate isomerase RpiB
LEGRGHEIINAGMKTSEDKPDLLYTHTGLMTAILLNLKRVDFVVGGCGTGQGFFNAAMQFPGVFCGYIASPLDAWLCAQINAGNCISLPLTQGYGWAADVNLRFIFDKLFSVEWGGGYPSHRKEPQRQGRLMLEKMSRSAHCPFASIISTLPDELIRPVLGFPGMLELIDMDSIEDKELESALRKRAEMATAQASS